MMHLLNTSEVAHILGVPCTSNKPVSGVSIDSRTVKDGDLFIAVKGAQFDGHQFLSEAVQNGAVAVIVSRKVPSLPVEQYVVTDTIDALRKIATAYRNKFKCKVIALTGSNGKTSVKEMIAKILPQPSHATPGNLNNHIGVPLSVFQLKKSHQYAVFELGANHLGEIANTVSIVQPDVALINNIAPAHVEGFGSIDGVARAKGEIYQGLKLHGTAIVNKDDDYANFWNDCIKDKNVIHFSRDGGADIYSEEISMNNSGCYGFKLITPDGQTRVELQVPGLHNVSNALAAASCTFALGIPLEQIQKGLSDFSGVSGRMARFKGYNDCLVIDDTYNANLRSTLASLEVLANYPGKRIFVFGDMGELGNWTRQHHEEVGLAASQLGIDAMFTFGKHSAISTEAFGSNAKHYEDSAVLAQAILNHLDSSTVVLVKGSRAARMEKIVNYFR